MPQGTHAAANAPAAPARVRISPWAERSSSQGRRRPASPSPSSSPSRAPSTAAPPGGERAQRGARRGAQALAQSPARAAAPAVASAPAHTPPAAPAAAEAANAPSPASTAHEERAMARSDEGEGAGEGDGVAAWYAGRTLLLTGGAGFVGKVLLEKLLRCCPDVRRVYVLLRAKRGASPARRLQDLLQLPVFGRLRAERPDALRKCVAVEGDLLREGLGLRDDERLRLHEEVSVVFHGAASLRLEADLRSAVQHNTQGTQRLLDLCRGMRHLQALVHLSTAFCHCEEEALQERVYAPLRDPREVMRVVHFLNDASLAAITPQLLGKHPNSYTFSKRLAETIVDEEKDHMPVVIVRPSIVCPSLKEPLPGWVDSLNGPIGLSVGAGKGVIRSMLCGTDFNAEVIPVDIVSNFMIVAAWDRAVNKKDVKETPVYNVSNGDVVKVTWKEVVDRGRVLAYQYPFDNVVWYPDGNIRTNRLVHNLIVFFFQTIPAYFIDLLLLLCFQKTFMVRLQKRISVGMEVLQYFTMRQWDFKIEKFKSTVSNLSPKDMETFYTTNVDVDMDKYLLNVLLGARQYCMKEPLSSLPRARRHLKMMYVIHQLAKLAFYGFIIYFFLQYVEPIRYVLDYVLMSVQKTPAFNNVITFVKEVSPNVLSHFQI